MRKQLFFCGKDCVTLAQTAQRSSGCPISGEVQGQGEWGFEQLGRRCPRPCQRG